MLREPRLFLERANLGAKASVLELSTAICRVGAMILYLEAVIVTSELADEARTRRLELKQKLIRFELDPISDLHLLRGRLHILTVGT